MFSVFASSSLLAAANPVQILIGQYITNGEQNDKGVAKSEYVLFQCIQCEDMDVLAEQMDCIEDVLPTSLQVLGVHADASACRKVEVLLKDHHSYGDLIIVERKEGNFVAYHVGAKQSSTIVLGKVEFSQFDCAIFSRVCALPLLLATADTKETIVALDEKVSLSHLGVKEKVRRGKQLGALPGGCARCVIPLVLNFDHTRGCDIFKYMQKYVDKAQQRGTTCVQVQSKTYAGLVFCCFCKELSTPLSEELWKTVSEMIGDAVGETVTRDQLTGATASTASSQRPAKESQPPVDSTTNVTKQVSKGDKTNNNNMVLYLGIAVMVLAVAVVWLCS